ncbi:GGDEF domain-containing response regulator [Rhodocyclus tenuis]|uniref:diguanylate cyclase n=1 Tax=Rhodocyclus tenuis TaxID=1066 RepID=A0A840G411_RHOTE|nr:diguanylate cyclase [Rhodocyclus tenuis]MBB4249164.1 diguanylate cyclase (GGDEF)-like protein [Rhodocyclus tenuis]
MKILVIEDNASHRRTLCEHVGRLGMSVRGADSGSSGVELFLAERPDVLLLASRLAEIDAFAVCRHIRQVEPPGEWTPIIFLIAAGDDAALQRSVAAGGDDFLSLPVSEVAIDVKLRAMQRQLQMRQSLLATTRKLDTANQQLQRLASLDSLTGAANRRYFDATLEREWRRSMREGSTLSVVMVDIDLFKQFNDHYGHPAGDECIRRVAAALAADLDRGGDLLARYGGEEFAAILPGTTLGGASIVALRMRDAVAALAMTHAGSPHGKVTASFGVACGVAMPETAAATLLAAADRALYQAKADGRNRVHVTTSLDPDCFISEEETA